ncbi:putative thiopurine S-methyltransferase [Yarrowia lipolytica]|jgi:thiopurine S-methyltransferase|uniref:Probable thiopurine S-methyltransferase n=2 Tax=Yarrowia lipolytica TaxID=4952 RepID=TPMT_YARLI|nr:YALI0E05467p [Yarrowia lipolytica CLIB122]Q6C6X6.1 RecName: Full=Probable thiopurine S-methyltransferase; Short=Thiopurine methyltransferase [Yarrowia lipolytica CLIB122]AOW04991.1 hypothetical protein YALI1_E06355g [Yarrowia lipolytica]KAB8286187.1 putative thiopurine S-methyltransferase [Yarrowia lipolytica]KAE8171510.1 putative thiopurine S-methyltransferase [Yarrowia lipolytica]KAJ8056564.1 putative thiopurine S-methyltransferase [Yarrowia lipolytica]QNP98804.1 Putative thiopurine S-me|eukprot:XP_503586.1 YALI0E05467p [Yarrowia lipolytica CLIB122]
MKPEFWQDRWNKDQIGWHQKSANPHLVKYWPTLNISQGSTVIVPLCGKSLDMRWLEGLGYNVLGVELSEKACKQYFDQMELEPKVSKNASGKFTIYEAGNTQIWCGDLFDLDADDVKYVSALYDRASVIALPPDMRERYAAHLGALIPDPQGLIITLDYDQSKMNGPPHAVSDAEVQRLFGTNWKLTLLEEVDKKDMFKEEGIEPVERVYKLN